VATGFVTGLGGLATLPITLPADLFANYFIQVRMIAAIAVMSGHDLKSDKVRSLVYLCLCGNAAADILKDVGTQAGKRAVEAAVARATARGAANLGKAIPLIGGLVGGAVDGFTCNLVGTTAKNVFLRNRNY
ncbi:MAG: EcsC family protein, partial [Deltaproteobacteria bacterium]|nr:EcsC family protein [Deltaproteobacteria bacterium]